MKQYCTCSNKDYISKGLSAAGPALDGQIKWVHWACGRPHPLYWQAHVRICGECLGGFSAPWEKICRDCACESERDMLSYPYRSWKWARVQRHSWEESVGEPVQVSPAGSSTDPQTYGVFKF